MADFPIEVWHAIFDHLELTDLPSCALVSKALYTTVKAYRVREVAFNRRFYKWFHLDLSIYQHRVDASMAALLKRSSFSLEHLKRLKIGRISSIEDLEEINKFTHLEELDLDLKNYGNQHGLTLSLANLRVLHLFMPDHLPYLELDTPKLKKVCTASLKKLDFLYPDSVCCIHTLFHNGKLCMFRNLEHLLFTDRYMGLDYNANQHTSKSLKEFNLSPLKKLKEVEFYFLSFPFEQKNLSKIQKMIETILAFGRPDLKVFWMNVRFTDANLLNEYEETKEIGGALIAFQMKNYEKLKNKLKLLRWFNFNLSMNLLRKDGFDLKSEEFTSKFLARFFFTKISVSRLVEYTELLLELIARSPNLISIFFTKSGLDQSFFDRMADTVRQNGIPLRYLQFKNASKKSLSYDFVLGFRHLEWFRTDQLLPNELISKLLALPLLNDIQLASGKFKIGRISANRFQLNGENLSCQELLQSKQFEPESGLYRFASRENLMGISFVLLMCGIRFFACRNKQL